MLVKEIDFLKDIFQAYPHQRDFLEAFFSGEYRYFMEMLHRRAGKDAAAFHATWLYASIYPGNYVYTLPKIQQARNVIWEGKDLNGKRWLDTIPKHLIKKVNNTDLKLYINNSMLHVTGADALMNSHLGSNLKGIVMSEFHKTAPAVWDYIRPILKRSNGWAIFPFTAFGKGHAYRLFEKNKGRPEWLCRKLTVDDTRDNKGKYIFSPEQIQEERDSGMDEDLIQQEYYCSSDAAVKGTFFAEQIALAYKEKRIVPKVEVDFHSPVHVSWDLGSRDTNSMWFYQVVNAQYRYFYQHDKTYGSIPYYLKLLEDVQKRFGFKQYGHHFMPHDTNQTEWTSGKTRRQTLIQAGINVTMVPMLRVMERVQVARSEFARVVIDENNCRHGLDALASSRSKYNESLKAFSSDEVHDWASHASAAFQYGLVGWMDTYNKTGMQKQKQYARLRA